MSNVGASSFEAQLPAVLAAIARARFVAIDCEFSGLAPRAALRSSPLDCLDARWAKLRASAQAMQLLQFGVCTFEDAPPGAAAGAAPRRGRRLGGRGGGERGRRERPGRGGGRGVGVGVSVGVGGGPREGRRQDR